MEVDHESCNLSRRIAGAEGVGRDIGLHPSLATRAPEEKGPLAICAWSSFVSVFWAMSSMSAIFAGRDWAP